MAVNPDKKKISSLKSLLRDVEYILIRPEIMDTPCCCDKLSSRPFGMCIMHEAKKLLDAIDKHL